VSVTELMRNIFVVSYQEVMLETTVTTQPAKGPIL